MTAADLYRAILHGTPYPVRGMVGFGANLLLSQPGATVARAAAERLDFLVYADLFLTPTAAMADVVLPVSSAWEREGLRVGFGPTQAGESFAQLRRAVVAPQGEARSDTWIVCELARRLGLGKSFFDGSEDAGHRFALEPSGVTLEQLRAQPGGVRVPVEARFKRYTAPGPDGRSVGFATPSRRVEIFSAQLAEHGQNPLPDYVEPAASPVSRPDLAARFPLRLTTAKVVQFCHSQHRSLPRLRRHSPEPLAELHPEAAKARAIGGRRLGGGRDAARHHARAGASQRQPRSGGGLRAVRLVAGVPAARPARLPRRRPRQRQLQRPHRPGRGRPDQRDGGAPLVPLRGTPRRPVSIDQAIDAFWQCARQRTAPGRRVDEAPEPRGGLPRAARASSPATWPRASARPAGRWASPRRRCRSSRACTSRCWASSCERRAAERHALPYAELIRPGFENELLPHGGAHAARTRRHQRSARRPR